MQDYTDFAKKNGVELLETGSCQFCGAQTQRGIHECLDIFNLGFQLIDFSNPENHYYRFLIVDAHTLQHPEIHGRWSNHFHLTRLCLIFEHEVKWTYALSPKLSDYLNDYKQDRDSEYLTPPQIGERGDITTTQVLQASSSAEVSKQIILSWAKQVYESWSENHSTVNPIAAAFLKSLY